MTKRMNKTQVMGAHWKDTGYSPLYQLYRRVESVARELHERQKGGWSPLKRHVDELHDISIQLKVLASRGRSPPTARRRKRVDFVGNACRQRE